MPFSDPFRLPPGFEMPQLELYDSTGDPIKHLQGYISNMMITSNNPDVYARAFPNSLTGRTRDWYLALPLKMIDTYQQTADAFDELTAAVTTHIELEELKVGAGLLDLREIVLRKDANVKPKKPPVWDRIQRDMGQLARKPYKSTFPQRGMNFENVDRKKFIQEGHLKEFTRDRGHKRPQRRGTSPPHYLPSRWKNSPPSTQPL
ncbi:hypothetical protein LIER_19340 [Lithospermum erythrorhizon]|uniref:Retrotransposon gag domain-containing protein n=1 Tax=Lithospermum erythrorhizon TaxID=34254 RepID=A0AAV3QLQ9_LITER